MLGPPRVTVLVPDTELQAQLEAEREKEAEGLLLEEGLPLALKQASAELDTELLGLRLPLLLLQALTDLPAPPPAASRLGLPEALRDTEGQELALEEAEAQEDQAPLKLLLALLLPVALALLALEAEASSTPVPLTERLGEAEREAVAEAQKEALPVTVALAQLLRVPVAVPELLPLKLPEALPVAHTVAEGDRVPLPLPVGLREGEPLPEGEPVGERLRRALPELLPVAELAPLLLQPEDSETLTELEPEASRDWEEQPEAELAAVELRHRVAEAVEEPARLALLLTVADTVPEGDLHTVAKVRVADMDTEPEEEAPT
jgi:hypothetical protein